MSPAFDPQEGEGESFIRQLILSMSDFSKPFRCARALGLILAGMVGLALSPGPEDLKGRTVVLTVRHEDLNDGVRVRALRQYLRVLDSVPVQAVVLEISAQSGYEPKAAALLLDDLLTLKVPRHAYVRTSALGMGALLALGCDTISMHPGAVIGGAAPTFAGKPEEAATLQTLSVLRARLRGLAAMKGRDAKLLETMVGMTGGGGPGEPAGGREEIVTLTAAEAKAGGLAVGVAESLEVALAQAGVTGERVQIGEERWASEGPAAGRPIDAGEPSERPEPGGSRTRESYAGKIVVIGVGWDDLMAKARFQFMERVLAKARREKPVALIVEMDTPGGYALETSKILRPFQDLSFPTYTFVNTHAESAGSLIALATDHIYMYPSSTIGSALPVTGLGEDPPGNLSKKIEAMTRAEVRNIAIAKGHNPEVAEAFVTTETELVIDGVEICRKGEVLNLNAVEATRIFNGKPLLAKGMARSLEEIVAKEGLSGELLRVRPSPFEAFAQWVQLVSAILIAIGLAAAYAEMNTPGFGLAGFIAVLAFGLFFFGNYVAGNMAGYETAFVFGLGLVLVIVDLFLFPGTFLAGIVGLFLMAGALGFSMVDREAFGDLRSGGKSSPGVAGVFGWPAVSLSIGFALAIGAIGLLMRFLPGLHAFQRLVLQTAVPSGTSMAVESLLGAQGEAVTDLRPTGRARIGTEIVDVATGGEFLAKGTPVRVSRVHADRVIVAAAAPG
jgi:membrane-bound serine protease (ClpP class)